jgi:hypothetical protein
LKLVIHNIRITEILDISENCEFLIRPYDLDIRASYGGDAVDDLIDAYGELYRGSTPKIRSTASNSSSDRYTGSKTGCKLRYHEYRSEAI